MWIHNSMQWCSAEIRRVLVLVQNVSLGCPLALHAALRSVQHRMENTQLQLQLLTQVTHHLIPHREPGTTQ